MANKRLYYANQVVGLKPFDDAGGYQTVFGVQDVSISTNFNLTPIFEFGQLQIYEQLEDLPDVEVSMSKVFDGKPLIWHLATMGQVAGPSLGNRSAARTTMALGIYPDTNNSVNGAAPTMMQSSGLYPQTISYSMSADGSPFTESVTFVGNDKIWRGDTKILNPTDQARAAALSFTPHSNLAGNNDVPSGIDQSNTWLWSYDVYTTDINGMVADPDATILPPEINGISSSGTNEITAGDYGAHLQSCNISVDLGRETIDELGRRGPYFRYAQFPTEVTCSFEAISISGDFNSATEGGILSTGSDCNASFGNLANRTIRIATCGGVRLYLGTKNRLSSIDYGNATTDGGNSSNTYNFSNFNDLTVMAEYDPNPSGANWWTARTNYLVN